MTSHGSKQGEAAMGPCRFWDAGRAMATAAGLVATLAAAAPAASAQADSCTASERKAALRAEQADVKALVGDLMTLAGPADLARLAAADPATDRGAYNFLAHQFASAGGMGIAIIDSASLATGITPGRPNLLLYEPKPGENVFDPLPDFPYRLVGWGYIPDSAYDWIKHPTDLDSRCITRADWFVHERSIHPADTGQNRAVPPPKDDDPYTDDPHGTAVGDEPITPGECEPRPCPLGFQHPRTWDIHFWLDGADDGVPSLSIQHPRKAIDGWDPGIGVGFFHGATVEETASFSNCHDLAAGVPGVPEEKAKEYVGQDYTLAAEGDEADLKLTPRTIPLNLSELRCEQVSVDGKDPIGPVSMALGFFNLTGAPSRSQEKRKVGDAYLLFWLTDSKPFADWLRNGTHLEAYHVPDLTYVYPAWQSLQSPGAHTFSFEASPLASPKWAYTVSGHASVQHQAPVPFNEGWLWQDTKTTEDGTWRVKIAISARHNYLAPTGGMTIRASGFELANIVGTDSSVDPFAVSGLIDRWVAVKTRTHLEPLP